VVAATTGVPVAGGARLHVATDVPAEIELELSDRPSLRGARRIGAGRTGAFDAAIAPAGGGRPGRRTYWRARVRRAGLETVGPVRSFPVLPRAGARGPVTLAVASCGSRFGPAFDAIAARRPDALVWQGDLNYPDTHGPLAQTTSAYAGIWRDFLSGPRLAPILERAAFACQRDDHDYGLQDVNGADRPPPEWGIAPWDALMNDRLHYRFAAGAVEVWVLDQRRFKSAATLPDTPAKTLLGAEQRAWLMRTLAASRAPFKIICSPCTLHHGDNARDGNWGSGFTAERDLLLAHIAEHVGGRTLFVTGDSHDTMAYERDGVVELRACPVSIPEPRDHPGLYGPGGSPAEGFTSEGIVFADTASHFCLVEARSTRRRAVLDVTLVREDGVESYTRRFAEPRS
jgi:alkaline phosphatase D